MELFYTRSAIKIDRVHSLLTVRRCGSITILEPTTGLYYHAIVICVYILEDSFPSFLLSLCLWISFSGRTYFPDRSGGVEVQILTFAFHVLKLMVIVTLEASRLIQNPKEIKIEPKTTFVHLLTISWNEGYGLITGDLRTTAAAPYEFLDLLVLKLTCSTRLPSVYPFRDWIATTASS